jgi:hypothetical protein
MVAAEGAAVVVLERADDGEFHAARAASSTAARGADAGSVQVMGAATAMPSPVDEGDEWSARALGEACGAVGCTIGDVAVLQGSGLASLDRSAALAVAKASPGVAAVTSCTGIVLAAVMIRTGRIPPVAGQRRPFDGVPWADQSTGALPFAAVTTLTRAVQGQVGAIRLRGVPSSAQESW